MRTRIQNEGNVVKEYVFGKSVVKICDDFCRNKTQEEIGEILDRIAAIVLRAHQNPTRPANN